MRDSCKPLFWPTNIYDTFEKRFGVLCNYHWCVEWRKKRVWPISPKNYIYMKVGSNELRVGRHARADVKINNRKRLMETQFCVSHYF
jgi:hypothetical protein